MHAYSLPSRPHHRSHVSISWALPQALAFWEIPPHDQHAADHLLAETSVHESRSEVTPFLLGVVCHRRAVLSAGSTLGAYHGRGSPWPRDRVLLGPSLSTRLAGRF